MYVDCGPAVDSADLLSSNNKTRFSFRSLRFPDCILLLIGCALLYLHETCRIRNSRSGALRDKIMATMTTLFEGYDEEYRSLTSDISNKLSQVSTYENEQGACSGDGRSRSM